MISARALTAFMFGILLPFSLAGGFAVAGDKAIKTTARLPIPANGLPGTDNGIPSFTTLAALDEYYNAADSGQCGDNCLASLWLKLGAQGKVTILDSGMAVWVLRHQTDPESSSYHVCRVLYYPPNTPGGVNSWVLCANIDGMGL